MENCGGEYVIASSMNSITWNQNKIAFHLLTILILFEEGH